jgi:phospholipase C
LDGLYCNICNPFDYEAPYPGMVANRTRDVTDLFTDITNGTHQHSVMRNQTA